MMPWVVPGAALHGELRELERAGLSAEEALAAATVHAATFFPSARFGRIAEGNHADLVIFREDPTQDLAALDSLVAVIVDGRLYQRQDLAQMQEIHEDHFNGPFYRTVMTALIRQITGAFTPEHAEN